MNELFDFKPQDYVNPLTVKSSKLTLQTNELCNCLHPTIILHPHIKEFIAQHRNYTFLGKTYYVDGRLYPHFEVIFRPGSKMNLDDIDKCYVTDQITGEVFPMYILVECGHCAICKSQKVNSFAHRCLLETQCYPYRPWFITLTYSDSLLPKDGASVEHCQLFMKRLRSRLDYYGIDLNIRYVCVSEYGSNTHRLHYHLLVWNFPNWKFWKVSRVIRKCWNKGHVYVSQVSDSYIVKGTRHRLSKPEKCFEYVAKYICKDCAVPPGMKNTFMLTSRRHGGIGAPYLDLHKDYIRRYRRWSFEFVDKFSESKRKLVYCRYVVDRLFPSKFQSVPVKFRNAVRYICRYAYVVPGGTRLLDKVRRLYKPWLLWSEVRFCDWFHFTRNINSPGFVKCRSCSIMYKYFWSLARYVLGFKDFDFFEADRLDEQRAFVLSKLTEHKPIRDLYIHNHMLVKNRALAMQHELL